MRFFALMIFFLLTAPVRAGLRVLLCSEGIQVKVSSDSVVPVLPGQVLKGEVTVSSSAYPAYIALCDYTGRFLEKNLRSSVELKSLMEEISQKPVCTLGKGLIDLSLDNLIPASEQKRLVLKYNTYRSLSHLPTMGPVRCPEPKSELLGPAADARLEKRVYTIYVYADTGVSTENLTAWCTNLFDDPIDSFRIRSFKGYPGIQFDFSEQRYHKDGILLKLKDRTRKVADCDSKIGILMTPEESERKNEALKNLLKEFPDPASPLTLFMSALLHEDYRLYYNSVELYIKIHDRLKGKNKSFGRHLYFYLLSPYLSYSLYK